MVPLIETLTRNERFSQFLLESGGCVVGRSPTFPQSDRGLPQDRPIALSPKGGGDRMIRLKGRLARVAAALATIAALAMAGGAWHKL